MAAEAITVGRGAFGSAVVRVTPGSRPSVAELNAAVDGAAAGGANGGKRPSAVYVVTPYPDAGGYGAALAARAPPVVARQVLPGGGEIQHYCWLGAGDDKVPPPSTQNLGVSVLLVGVDRSVCLVRERGRDGAAGPLKFPSGTVDAGELPTAAAVREVREELGLRVEELAAEPEFALLNGYFLDRHLGQPHIGDIHLCFVVRVQVALDARGVPRRIQSDGSLGGEIVHTLQEDEIAKCVWLSHERLSELVAAGKAEERDFKGSRFVKDWVARGAKVMERPLASVQTRHADQSKFYFF